jgi:hypothetical protein
MRRAHTSPAATGSATGRLRTIAPGRRTSRTLLVLLLLAGALAFGIARPGPASARDIHQTPDEIVLTSVRMHDETVRATLTLTLRRNGDVILRADMHNSGRTRKFAQGKVTATFPDAGFSISAAAHPWGRERIDRDSYITWDEVAFEPRLAQRWDLVSFRPIEASFHLDVKRVGGA